jgi:hypothetical protein
MMSSTLLATVLGSSTNASSILVSLRGKFVQIYLLD